MEQTKLEKMTERLGKIDNYKKVQSDFLTRAATNPAEAFKFAASAMLVAQFRHEYCLKAIEFETANSGRAYRWSMREMVSLARQATVNDNASRLEALAQVYEVLEDLLD